MQNQARHSEEGLNEVHALLMSLAERKADDMMPKVQSELPPDTPLTMSITRASKVFDTSETTLRRLVKVPGFPVVRLGSSVKVLTYKALKWLEANQGEVIDLPE